MFFIDSEDLRSVCTSFSAKKEEHTSHILC